MWDLSLSSYWWIYKEWRDVRGRRLPSSFPSYETLQKTWRNRCVSWLQCCSVAISQANLVPNLSFLPHVVLMVISNNVQKAIRCAKLCLLCVAWMRATHCSRIIQASPKLQSLWKKKKKWQTSHYCVLILYSTVRTMIKYSQFQNKGTRESFERVVALRRCSCSVHAVESWS